MVKLWSIKVQLTLPETSVAVVFVIDIVFVSDVVFVVNFVDVRVSIVVAVLFLCLVVVNKH